MKVSRALLGGIAIATLVGCDLSLGDEAEQGEGIVVTVEGTIVDAESRGPLEGATVTVHAVGGDEKQPVGDPVVTACDAECGESTRTRSKKRERNGDGKSWPAARI